MANCHFITQYINSESQHSAVRYLDKRFSSLQMYFMQYNYEPKII